MWNARAITAVRLNRSAGCEIAANQDAVRVVFIETDDRLVAHVDQGAVVFS
jgi:hypothetical protein